MNFEDPLSKLTSSDLIGLAVTIVGISAFDIIALFAPNIIVPPAGKILTFFVLVTGFFFYSSRKRVVKAKHIFEPGSLQEAEFFERWYKQQGRLFIFCNDIDWLDAHPFKNVVDVLKNKGNQVHLFLKVDSNRIVDELRGRNVQIYKVRTDINFKHRLSIREDDPLCSIIIRNKEVESNRIAIEEYHNHTALVDLAKDMLNNSYHDNDLIMLNGQYLEPYTRYTESLVAVERWSPIGNPPNDSSRLFELCSQLLDSVTGVFDGLTGIECSCCIKLFIHYTDQPIVRTFCRDRRSRNRRGARDGNDAFTIQGNTAFSEILEQDAPYFFSNDLLSHTRYYNEHVRYHDHYLSTVVIPIKSTGRQFDATIGQYVNPIVGFLCVDSKNTNVFDENQTVNFLALVAGVLYVPLRDYLKGLSL